jgi:hypothetical protein
MKSAIRTILPRQGEVAPKVTEGEEHTTAVSLTSPSVWQVRATSPLRGRIDGTLPDQRNLPLSETPMIRGSLKTAAM